MQKRFIRSNLIRFQRKTIFLLKFYTLSYIQLFFLEEMSRMITQTNEIAPDLALKPKLRKITFHPS